MLPVCQIWRVYQRGLERWFTRLLQPVFDRVVEQGRVPPFVQRLKIMELDFDHEAPRFSNLRRRSTRKDSDLSALVDVRYTGAMRMLLVLEVGGGRWRLKVRDVVMFECNKTFCAVLFLPSCAVLSFYPFMSTCFGSL